MEHVTKNFCIISFLDFYQNVYNRSATRKSILARSVVIRSSAKLALRHLLLRMDMDGNLMI